VINRASLSSTQAEDLDTRALVAAERRAANSAAKLCINAPSPAAKRRGPTRVSHEGPLDGSGRCARCAAVKRGGAP